MGLEHILVEQITYSTVTMRAFCFAVSNEGFQFLLEGHLRIPGFTWKFCIDHNDCKNKKEKIVKK